MQLTDQSRVSGPPSLLPAAQTTRFRRAWLEESRGSSELSNSSPETARVPHQLSPSRRSLFTPRALHGAGAASSLPPRGRGSRTHTSEDELQTPVLSCAQARNRLTRMRVRAHTHGPTCMHVCTHTMVTQTGACVRTRVHAPRSRVHLHTRAHGHACAHTHVQAHTRTHTLPQRDFIWSCAAVTVGQRDLRAVTCEGAARCLTSCRLSTAPPLWRGPSEPRWAAHPPCFNASHRFMEQQRSLPAGSEDSFSPELLFVH